MEDALQDQELSELKLREIELVDVLKLGVASPALVLVLHGQDPALVAALEPDGVLPLKLQVIAGRQRMHKVPPVPVVHDMLLLLGTVQAHDTHALCR